MRREMRVGRATSLVTLGSDELNLWQPRPSTPTLIERHMGPRSGTLPRVAGPGI